MKITVLGAGSWGTTLAVLLTRKNHDVTLWSHRIEHTEELSRTRENPRYLKGEKLPAVLSFSANMKQATKGSEMIIVVTPAQQVRTTLEQFQSIDTSNMIFVNASKGIERSTGFRMSQVTKDVLPQLKSTQIASLYGPSHAEEVILNQPTAVVAASDEIETAKIVQDAFGTPMFRVYANTDLIGVEIAGSVKNIMAIAAGVCDGVGYGDNAKAAIITRGLSEITRFGIKLGANPQTFSGLAGIGDLVVTCASRHSRNRFVGEQIGKGRTLDEVLNEIVMIAEGVPTTRATVELAKKLGVEMPLTEAVYDVLFENKPPREAVYDLMSREQKEEYV